LVEEDEGTLPIISTVHSHQNQKFNVSTPVAYNYTDSKCAF